LKVFAQAYNSDSNANLNVGKQSRVKDLRPDADELPQASQPQQWLGVKESIIVFFDFCEYLPRPTIEIPMPNLSSPTEASGDQPLGI